jgi:hypothetical protein
MRRLVREFFDRHLKKSEAVLKSPWTSQLTHAPNACHLLRARLASVASSVIGITNIQTL